ncbi:MAG: cell division protein FtsZ [Rhodospirillaceae bacterium]
MINLSMPTIDTELKPRITVFGVGGAGGNAVNNMIKSNLEGVEFVVGNTDAQALNGSLAQRRIQLGTTITRGLGAGSRPDVGRAAAEEQIDEIAQHLDGTNMVFITGGMGGGTGTGAAPVIARIARERGILTVGVVTKPFHFEGAHRMRLAESGIAELQQYVDTLIIIPNQNLFRIANEKTTFADAFKMADDVLHSGVRGVTDLMVMPGLINLDFADIRSVMTEMGKAMMGTGEAGGERRSIQAAEAAISNPLLDDVSMKGARGVLINITGGYDMTLFEVDEAANRIRDEVDPDANIIFGSTFDPQMEGIMRVSVVATGIDAASMAISRHQPAAAAVAAPAPAQPVAQPAPSFGLGSKRPGAAAPASPSRPDYHSTLVASPSVPANAQAAVAGAASFSVQSGSGQSGSNTATARAYDLDEDEAVNEAEVAPSPANPQAAAAAVRAALGAEAAPGRSGGPLRGERRDGSFIAPRPVDPGPRQPAAVEAEDRPQKRSRSLFERVTGLGWRGREDEDADLTQTIPASTSARTVAPAPAAGRAQPASQAAPARAPTATRNEGARPGSARADEDVLDIPAFLRRQAN